MSTRKYVTEHDIISVLKAKAKENGEHFTRAKAYESYKQFMQVITDFLAEGQDVVLINFCKLELVDRPARTVRKPMSDEMVYVPAKSVVKVRNRKLLHDLVTVHE